MRVPGTAIFMTRDLDHVPDALLHAMKHNKALHERVVLMQVETQDVPHVPDEHRLDIRELGKNFYTISVRYGFMDEPNIVRALAQCRRQNFHFSLMETSFIIGREKIARARSASSRSGAGATGSSSAVEQAELDATEFFRIPPNRVIELGGQIEI